MICEARAAALSITMTTLDLRRTALYDRHIELHARMVGFGGFEMPVQYAGMLREYEAVRKRAGLFDLSHMGQITLRGDGAGAWADRLTVNYVDTLQPGGARYNLFCNERGGTHDDVIFYRESDKEWLLVINASNTHKIWDMLSLSCAAREGVAMERCATRGLIAIQGPSSEQILGEVVSEPDRARIRAMEYFSCGRVNVRGADLVIARTGYTGEGGFELFASAGDTPALWDVLLEAGAPYGLEPCGLGARDFLRLEAGMPLYGHELDEDITPLQARLDWARAARERR
jgi:aminomethyltransferase